MEFNAGVDDLKAAFVGEFDGDHRVHGYILSWHGKWGHDIPEVRELMKIRNLAPTPFALAIRSNPFYQHLWSKFKEFIVGVCKQLDWPIKSGKMEITLKRQSDFNLIHFHAAVTDNARRHRCRDGRLGGPWTFLGSRPKIVPCNGRGRQLTRALDAAHYYVQAPKIGSVFTFANQKIFTEIAVELNTIFNLWRKQKLESLVAIDQFMRARGLGTRKYISEVQFHEDWLLKHRERALKELIERLIVFKPFKTLPKVVSWMHGLASKFAQATRFPFLVLDGESKFGKTIFAKHLYGPECTLVVSCQRTSGEPNLKRFRRDIHKCIVFDEANHKLVFDNKQVFQAGLVQVQLAQSTCQEHAYQVFLYGVPMIVSTNEWCLGAADHEKAWLDANSVVVSVTEHLWHEFLPVQDEA